MKKIGIVKANPNFDWCIGLLGGEYPIPTKQDKFKPLEGLQGVLKQEGMDDVIFENLYVKKPDKENVQKFEESFREKISERIEGDAKFPIKQPEHIEVVLYVLVKKKRFFDVDVDNLAKAILDCVVGLVIEDDSQIVKLLVRKDIHPDNINGLAIGVRQINANRKSIIEDIKLFTAEEKEVDD